MPSLFLLTMPGLGRAQSPWWNHFQVENGDFRLVRCLHCNKLVRRGKAGCSSREVSNSGMAKHMKSQHADQAMQVVLYILIPPDCKSEILQVQQRIEASKQKKEVAIDEKDGTVRGSLPLFKLRSKADRQKWQKLVMHEY